MKVIGIAGYMRSGKDTVAQLLIEELVKQEYKAIRRAFADPLKEEAARILCVNFAGMSYDEYLIALHSNEISNDRRKNKETYRLFLQWLGDYRRVIQPDYWIQKLIDYTKTQEVDFVIVPDVRYMNEIETMHKLGGLAILVTRPGTASGTHISENEIDNCNNWDYIIENDGNIDDLRVKIKHVISNTEFVC